MLSWSCCIAIIYYLRHVWLNHLWPLVKERYRWSKTQFGLIRNRDRNHHTSQSSLTFSMLNVILLFCSFNPSPSVQYIAWDCFPLHNSSLETTFQGHYKNTNILCHLNVQNAECCLLTLKVPVTTIDAQWKGMGDVGSARYEPALLPPCLTIRVLSYSN